MTTDMNQSSPQDVGQQIRKEFYALRNGLIADTLRKGGLKQKYIFGLQLPQIKAIGDRFRPQTEEEAAELAQILWSDAECREARLLACHLMPPSLTSEEMATEWAEGTATREEADILAFRLIRYLPFQADIADRLALSDNNLQKYTAEAIRRFI